MSLHIKNLKRAIGNYIDKDSSPSFITKKLLDFGQENFENLLKAIP